MLAGKERRVEESDNGDSTCDSQASTGLEAVRVGGEGEGGGGGVKADVMLGLSVLVEAKHPESVPSSCLVSLTLMLG